MRRLVSAVCDLLPEMCIKILQFHHKYSEPGSLSFGESRTPVRGSVALLTGFVVVDNECDFQKTNTRFIFVLLCVHNIFKFQIQPAS